MLQLVQLLSFRVTYKSIPMFWDQVYRTRHILEEFDDIEVYKTSVTVFIALFYLEMVYVLIMTFSLLNRMNQN